jgi:hypothetical protein
MHDDSKVRTAMTKTRRAAGRFAIRAAVVALFACCLAGLHAAEAPLELPPMAASEAAPGKRVLVTTAEYLGTEVHHQLYLPPDWEPQWKATGRSWPVIVEYTGNFFPPSGSTGQVEGAALGYGLSGGRCIWVVLPFVAEDHRHNEPTWWGDEQATVAYAKLNVPRLCADYGGDAKRVVICGFSRGAIAVNRIGLYDDEIARLWCGFMTHDHYDGVGQWPGTTWGFPEGEYHQAARIRLQRLGRRPALVCQRSEVDDAGTFHQLLHDIGDDGVTQGRFTFLPVPIGRIFPQIPNALFIAAHTDRWMFVDSDERRQAREWLERTVSGVESR